jgi:DNA polymerase III sliding clamp (beta) subunit (PCNA family)
MDLLAALKFVSGAVAKSDYLPALQHVAIGGGFVVSFNGTVALCAPIVLDLAVCPRADIFSKAIAACTETAQLHLTEQGLAVQSGLLRVIVPCSQDTFPRVFPEGCEVPLNSALLPALKALEPLVSTDTSKQMFNGILLRGGSAYATNNTILCEYWLGHSLAIDVNLPLPAVRELLRIDEEPTRVQVAERSATFHFANERWMRTSLYPTTWPQSLTSLLAHTEATPLPDGFFTALKQIAPFADQDVHFVDNRLATDIGADATSTQRATVKLPGIQSGPRFNLSQLRRLEELTTAINFTDYPQPCRFTGERTRGVILGRV